VLDELLNYLITNTYSKLPYLKVRQADPIAELKAVLTADDVAKPDLGLNGEVGNALALNELCEYLQLAASQSRVLLSDVVDPFAGIPWGWKPDWETVLLVARLFKAGEIKLVVDSRRGASDQVGPLQTGVPPQTQNGRRSHAQKRTNPLQRAVQPARARRRRRPRRCLSQPPGRLAGRSQKLCFDRRHAAPSRQIRH